MAKMFTLVLVVTGVWLLLALFGLSLTGGYILNTLHLGTPASTANIQSTPLWTAIFFWMTVLGAASAVVISFFGRNINTIPISALIATGILGSFVTDLFGIINMTTNVIAKDILWIIFTPLATAYIIGIWDWVRSIGSD